MAGSVRRIALYRWDFEMAKSRWAIAIVLASALSGAAVFTVFPAVTVGTDYLGSSAHVQLLLLAGVGGGLTWVVYYLSGMPYWNWIEFWPGKMRIRQTGVADISMDEIENIERIRPRYNLLAPFGLPSPFSSRWAIPPSGGYSLTLKRRKFIRVGWSWWHRCVYFAPWADDEFHRRLEEWWGRPIR